MYGKDGMGSVLWACGRSTGVFQLDFKWNLQLDQLNHHDSDVQLEWSECTCSLCTCVGCSACSRVWVALVMAGWQLLNLLWNLEGL